MPISLDMLRRHKKRLRSSDHQNIKWSSHQLSDRDSLGEARTRTVFVSFFFFFKKAHFLMFLSFLMVKLPRSPPVPMGSNHVDGWQVDNQTIWTHMGPIVSHLTDESDALKVKPIFKHKQAVTDVLKQLSGEKESRGRLPPCSAWRLLFFGVCCWRFYFGGGNRSVLSSAPQRCSLYTACVQASFIQLAWMRNGFSSDVD